MEGTCFSVEDKKYLAVRPEGPDISSFRSSFQSKRVAPLDTWYEIK